MRFFLNCASTFALLCFALSCAVAAPTLTLEHAITVAQQHDPWLSGSYHREQAGMARSIAADTLPDPTVSLGVANLPVDSFDLAQEPMTQVTVGLRQMFPRGKSRSLQRQYFSELSQQQPYLRANRRAELATRVTQQWLEVYRHQEAIRLIEKDRALFEHLVDVAQSSYSSAINRTRQQDLVRAQLELTRLEDRLTVLQQQQDMSRARLNQWLRPALEDNYALTTDLPQITLNTRHEDGAMLSTAQLLQHPAIKSIDQQVIASETETQLTRQKYKPQWGINAGYGYRDDDPTGNDRSDFFSVGVSLDVPLFSHQRQDKDVEAAVATTAAIKTEKDLMLRTMRANFETTATRWQRLNQRKTLYEKRLLQEIHDHAEAALNAYTNDMGDFAEVVRARIAELNANIDFLNITIDRLLAIAELNYFLAPTDNTSDGGLTHE